MNFFFHSARWFTLAEVQSRQADLFLLQMAMIGAGLVLVTVLFFDYFRK